MKASILLAILAIGFFGCKKDTFVEQQGKCPVVISTSPKDAATNVALDKKITIVFNEEIDLETITQSSIGLYGVSIVPSKLTYDNASFTATITPNAPLSSNTTYMVKVTTAIQDPRGNALQQDYTSTFSTGSLLSPMVIMTDPDNLETEVVLSKVVTASFSVPMDASTIDNTSFRLAQGTSNVEGSVSYSDSTASFMSTIEFLPNTEYTATIASSVKNTSGNPLANDYTWTFTTGDVSTAPLVISTDPSDSSENVILTKTITATFSESMDGPTIGASTFKLFRGTTQVTGVVSYSGTTASFDPSADLIQGSNYSATITTGAKTLGGIALDEDYTWTFRTASDSVPPAVDLKTAETYGILAGTGISNDAGISEIHDLDVGISPGVRASVTGFPPAILVNGEIFASDDAVPVGIAAILIQAKQDLTDAYLFAEAATNPAPASVSGDIGGVTLAPGIYKSTSTLLIQSGDLTLDAQGDPDAFWIFQIASGFTTVGGAGGNVILSGGAQAKNVFWQTGSSATIGDFTSFKGNILALTSITMNSGATAQGRMLARNGAVTLTSTNMITKP